MKRDIPVPKQVASQIFHPWPWGQGSDFEVPLSACRGLLRVGMMCSQSLHECMYIRSANARLLIVRDPEKEEGRKLRVLSKAGQADGAPFDLSAIQCSACPVFV